MSRLTRFVFDRLKTIRRWPYATLNSAAMGQDAPYEDMCRDETLSIARRFCSLYCLASSRELPIDAVFAEMLRPENRDWVDILKVMLESDSDHEAFRCLAIADAEGSIGNSRRVSSVLSKVLGRRTLSQVKRDDAHRRRLARENTIR